MDYLDFAIEVHAHRDDQYIIAVRSPAGEARTTAPFPFTAAALESHLLKLENAILRAAGRRRKAPTPEEEAVQSFGRELFGFLLRDELLSRFRACQQRAHDQQQGVRIKLTVTPPALADLPWEFLYDPARRDYLCLDATTPLVRYPELPLTLQPLPVLPPLRILGVCVDATDLTRLDVAEEKARLAGALQPLQAQGLVELVWLAGQTADDLQRALRRGPWHILHFIGHGRFDTVRDEGLLLLADTNGHAAPLYATQLARLLAHQRYTLRLVLLNACEGARGGGLDLFAGTAATLVGSGIPAVLAMQYEITDEAAIDFARTFYEALADNLPVDSAVADARNAMTLRNRFSLEWGTPVLYLRAPDGRLFDMVSIAQVTPLNQPISFSAKLHEEQTNLAVEVQEKKQNWQIHFDEAQKNCFSIAAQTITLDNINTSAYFLLDWLQRRSICFESKGGETGYHLLRVHQFELDENPSSVCHHRISQKMTIEEFVAVSSDTLQPTGRAVSKPAADFCIEQLAPNRTQLRINFWCIHSQYRELLQYRIKQIQETWPECILTGSVNTTVIAAPSQRKQLPYIDFDWVTIPAGKFWMGSDKQKDSFAYDDEQPQHEVNLPAYRIARMPVTNSQYKRFLDAKGYQSPSHWEKGHISTGKENHPVINVSWQDALAFCEWAGVKLPSEAEWEKAARGTDGRIYPWGNEAPDKARCNFNGNEGGTTPVDKYPKGQSFYGVWDMAGNVWEWTSSLFEKYPYKAGDGREDPAARGRRVVRGGSFGRDLNLVRSAYRNNFDIDSRNNNVGFRVVAPGS